MSIIKSSYFIDQDLSSLVSVFGALASADWGDNTSDVRTILMSDGYQHWGNGTPEDPHIAESFAVARKAIIGDREVDRRYLPVFLSPETAHAMSLSREVYEPLVETMNSSFNFKPSFPNLAFGIPDSIDGHPIVIQQDVVKVENGNKPEKLKYAIDYGIAYMLLFGDEVNITSAVRIINNRVHIYSRLGFKFRNCLG